MTEQDERVLVLMPTAKDGERTRDALARAGLACTVCQDLAGLCREIAAGAGVALLTEEAVADDRSGCLAETLRGQPAWSDFPLVVLARQGVEGRQASFREAVNVSLVERPLRVRSLLSVVRAALRSRRHQYAVRDHLIERERQAEALRESEGRARRLLEFHEAVTANMGEGLYAVDTQGRVTYVNPAAEALFGWTSAELLGRKMHDVTHYKHPDGRPFPAEECAGLRVLRDGTPLREYDDVFIRKDGSFFPVVYSSAPLVTEGRTVGLVVVFRDVTERKRAEEAQARLAAIVESSQDAIVGKTLDGVILSWNAGAERVFGYAPHEVIGRSIRLLIPPERQDEEEEILARIRRGESLEHYETVRVAKDGRRLDISLTVSPVRDRAGHVIGASKIARDISQRKEAENALRESEERYRRAAAEAAEAAAANAKFRAFFEQGTNFAGVLALDGRVVEPNRLCLDFCGFTRDEVLGKPFWECGWWNRSATLMDMVRAACLQAAGGRPFRTETPYFLAGGAERVVDLILAPVTDEAGRVLFVAATGTDVTDRRRMEDALREQDRRKDEFLALLAHELRNPLAPLRNGLQVLRLAEGDAGAVAQTRAMMERQLGHMVRLIDDLLDISRINRNKMELRRSRVLLADVVSSAVETARPLIETAGHELTLTLPPDPVYLDADLTRLAQVLSNLLTNSAKYTPPGGHIRLAAERCGEDVVVSVRDNGIGIPAESLGNIFDMFSQVDRSIERSTGGLGIGLALVKGLVEMHGGAVAAESAGLGQGSTFTVRLPALKNDPERRSEDASPGGPSANGPGRPILVVDDNRDGAASMAMMLRLMGNPVRVAHDGVEAVQVAEAFRPQVILMDVGMPRLNGYEATRRIREQPWGEGMIIIALTGWGQEGDRVQSKEAGCDGHLVKPVNLPDLETLLAELTESRGPPDAKPVQEPHR
jgi:PAS domain S-box-containing protein